MTTNHRGRHALAALALTGSALGLMAVAAGCTPTQKTSTVKQDSTAPAPVDLMAEIGASLSAKHEDIKIDEDLPTAPPSSDFSRYCRQPGLCTPEAPEKLLDMVAPWRFIKNHAPSHAYSPFPYKAVLAAMNRLRELFYISPTLADRRAAWDALPSEPQQMYYGDKGDNRFNNLGAAPHHWNDIQAHYYPNTPHARHGCYTLALYYLISDEGGNTVDGPVPPEKQRETAIQVCLGNRALPPEAASTSYGSRLNAKLFGYFKSMYDTQWVVDSKGTRLNVFEYIMTSDFYAFDFEQQQKLINEFYAGFTPIDGTGPSIADAEEVGKAPFNGASSEILAKCQALRPARQQENRFANYCSLQKEFGSQMGNIGR